MQRLDEGHRLVIVLFEAREPSAVDDALRFRGGQLRLAERDQHARPQGLRPAWFVVAHLDLAQQVPGAREVAEVPGDQCPDERPAPHVGADEDIGAAHRGEVLVDERSGLRPVAKVVQAPQDRGRPVGVLVRAQLPTKIEHRSCHWQCVRVGALDVGDRLRCVERRQGPLEDGVDRVEMRNQLTKRGRALLVAAGGELQLTRQARRDDVQVGQAELAGTLHRGGHRPGTVGDELRIREMRGVIAHSGGGPHGEEPQSRLRVLGELQTLVDEPVGLGGIRPNGESTPAEGLRPGRCEPDLRSLVGR